MPGPTVAGSVTPGPLSAGGTALIPIPPVGVFSGLSAQTSGIKQAVYVAPPTWYDFSGAAGPLPAGWTVASGTWAIDGAGKAYSSSGADNNIALVDTGDLLASITGVVGYTPGANQWWGIVVRYYDANNFAHIEVSDVGAIQVIKRIGGVQSNFTASAAGTVVLGDTVTVLWDSTTANVYVNGVLKATGLLSDTVLNNRQAAQAGMRLGATGTQTGVKWDAFGVNQTVGTASFSGSASFSAVGAFAATGTPNEVSAAGFTGSGNFVASGTPNGTDVAGFTGSGTLAASGKPAEIDAAGFTGTGTLVASGTANLIPSNFSGTAGFAGSGTLVADGAITSTIPVAFSGTGGLVASGTPNEVSVAGFTGSGTLASTGTPRPTSSAGFSGSGTLAATGVLNAKDAGAFSGGGTLAAASPLPAVKSSAAFSSTGTLVASNAGVNLVGSASLSGTGTFGAYAPGGGGTSTGNTPKFILIKQRLRLEI